ncbi:MAG: metallophosphoesterase [Sulfolobales archaeon]|nr:metallophosphoesterase [Sulfolobales archaeon]
MKALATCLMLLLILQIAINVASFKAQSSSEISIVMPGNVRPGLYDLRLVVIDGGVEKEFIVPRSIWVHAGLESDVIRIAHITDEHYFGSPNPVSDDLRRSAHMLIQLLNSDLVIVTGDLADGAAVNQYIQARGYWYSLLYTKPVFSYPGNHDRGTNNYQEYIGPREYYRVINGTILIAGVDTGDTGFPGENSLMWLEEVLRSYGHLPIKIIAFHHPIFSGQGLVRADYTNITGLVSTYWNVSRAQWMTRLVEEYGVTLVLMGHIHRDQYIFFRSTRTNASTYFITTTTEAQSRPDYNGFQVIDLSIDRSISFPIMNPWFVGFNYSTTVRNSIPIDTRYLYGYFYSQITQGNTAYFFNITNTLRGKTHSYNISGKVLLALPWAGDRVSLKLINASRGAGVELLDYITYNGFAYPLLNLSIPIDGRVEFVLYRDEDFEPPTIQFKIAIPSPPRVNVTNKLYMDLVDLGWGVKSASAYLLKPNGSLSPLRLEYSSGDTWILYINVTSSTTVNGTVIVDVVDFAGNSATYNLTITFYRPGETGGFYYGPPPLNATVEKFTRIDSCLKDSLPLEYFGPGSPAIVRPSEALNIKLRSSSLTVKEAYIEGAFSDNNRVIYRVYKLYPEVYAYEYVRYEAAITNTLTSTISEAKTTTATTTVIIGETHLFTKATTETRTTIVVEPSTTYVTPIINYPLIATSIALALVVAVLLKRRH